MLDNADKLISKLDKLAKVDNLNEVLNQACILVENQAKINCPVKYGTLRNSITHEVEGLQGVVGTNIEYAPYVELGARGRKGVHMLQRAATEHTDEYKQLMEDSMKNA